MSENLVVNPLAMIETLDDGVGVLVAGPVPGVGLKLTKTYPDENPGLYSLLTELRTVGLNNIDIRQDLTGSEVDLLREHGLIVDSDRVPEMPLFSCMLDDVDASGSGPGTVVNPTLEFEAFDLTKFRDMVNEKHLSPYNATAWVTEPETGLRCGYWLTSEQAIAVESLVPGSSVEGLNAELAAKLTAANILVDERRASSELQAVKERFAGHRYAVVNDMIPTAQVRALRAYYRTYCDQGLMKLGDNHVPLRFFAQNEPVAQLFHHGLTPLMQKLSGVELRPTYCYSVVYIEGAELLPHIDRADCEYSFSVQLDYVPETPDQVSPWPLYVSTSADPRSADPETDTPFYLRNGSALVYRGRELTHYRRPLPSGHRSASLFFHYVPLDD